MPAKKKSARVCKNGLHAMTPSNTYRHPSKGVQCRECIRKYQREYMSEWRAANKRAARKAELAKKRKAGR